MGKLAIWSVDDGCLVLHSDQEAIQAKAILDGCSVAYTALPCLRTR
jgi:hypothetical protein